MAKAVVDACTNMMDMIIRNISQWRREYRPIDENDPARIDLEAQGVEVIYTFQDQEVKLNTISSQREISVLSPTSSDSGVYSQHTDMNDICPMFYDENQNEIDSGGLLNDPNSAAESQSIKSKNSPVIPSYLSNSHLKPQSSNHFKEFNSAVTKSPSLFQINEQLTVSKSLSINQKFCDLRATCLKGKSCKEKHTKKEKEVFDARATAKNANARDFNEGKFRTQMCNAGTKHILLKCRFAHTPEELVCLKCLEVGHQIHRCAKA